MATKKGDVPPRLQKMDEKPPKVGKVMTDNNNKTGKGLVRERGKAKGK